MLYRKLTYLVKYKLWGDPGQNETDHLSAIPEMRKSILEGMKAGPEEFTSEIDW